MTDLTDQLDAIQMRADRVDEPGSPMGERLRMRKSQADVPFLLDLARKQQAAIDAAKALHVMEFIEDGEDSRSRCDECLYEQDADEPCPTIQALEAKP